MKKEDIGTSGNTPENEDNKTTMKKKVDVISETSDETKKADVDPLSDPLALDSGNHSEDGDEIEIIGEKKMNEITLSDDDDDSVSNVQCNISPKDQKLIE